MKPIKSKEQILQDCLNHSERMKNDCLELEKSFSKEQLEKARELAKDPEIFYYAVLSYPEKYGITT